MDSKERLSLEEMKAQANGGVVCRHCGGRSSPIDAVASKGTAGVLLRRTDFRAVSIPSRLWKSKASLRR